MNDRVYLPEELAKGDGMTLPLLLNHSSIAGAEGELHRLSNEMQDHLTQGRDYQVGEVTLTWVPDDLTLYYEGEIRFYGLKYNLPEGKWLSLGKKTLHVGEIPNIGSSCIEFFQLEKK